MRDRRTTVVAGLAVAGVAVLVSLVSTRESVAEEPVGAARRGAASPNVGGGPRPFDPLGIDEVKRAEGVALAYRGLSEALKGSRYRILVIERHEEDKEEAEKHPELRRADVTIYQYTAGGVPLDRTLYALVDFRKGSVAEFESLTGVTPPLHPDETAEALAIALRDRRVAAVLRESGAAPDEVGATARLFVRDEVTEKLSKRTTREPCFVNRCLALLLHTQTAPIPFLPLVNLTRQRVERVDPRE